MPIFGLDSKFPHANDELALTFFPRFQKQLYTKLCGMIRADRYVEPFSLVGAAPLMARFKGSVVQSVFKSWKLQVPQMLLKSKALLARQDIEFDQKKFIPKAIAAIGITLAESPAYQLARHMIMGHDASIATLVSDVDGLSYTATFDGLPTFSAAHTQFDGSTQSNIITGSFPTTAAAVRALTIEQQVAYLREAVTALIERITSIRDDKGRYIYADFDPADQLVLVVPPVWRQAAEYLKTPGVLVGGALSSSTGGGGSTTMIKSVKDVHVFGLLGKAIPDVENEMLKEISPQNETEFFAFIDNDLVRPYYWMRYVPPKGSDTSAPPSYDATVASNEIVAEAIKAGKNISIEAADWYSSAIIDHNLGAIGSNAQSSVVDNEQFFVSPRQRGTIVEGPWFTKYKVVPTGTSL